jgi:hypothetical protein
VNPGAVNPGAVNHGVATHGAVSDRLLLEKVKKAFGAGALGIVLAVAACFAGCTRQNAQVTPDAASLLQAVAPADPAKFPALQESKHWGNPYLVIRTEQVGMLSGVNASAEQILKPQEVLPALAHLPASAWPYGRAVAVLVDAKPTSSEQEKTELRRNRGIVAGELQSAHVAIRWIPSS